MADRISTLPDEVIYYILSFLPTKVAVATCVLSKRWKLLWRSVPAFDFDCGCCYKYPCSIEGINRFLQWINAFVLSLDPDQSIQRFSLRCHSFYNHPTICHPTDFHELVTNAVQHRLEHLDLCLPFPPYKIDLPSVVLSCKTLVVLKLNSLHVKAFFSIDLPSLKILHMYHVSFSEYRLLAELLSGCPNLEDMNVGGSVRFNSYAIEAKFKKLPKLVRALIYKHQIPLEVVYNVQFLRIEWIDHREGEIIEDLIPEFQNLTHIEFGYEDYNDDWSEVFKVLKHCPKIQNLFIDQAESPSYVDRSEWQYPSCVPKCISSHLKTCRINSYGGYETEFEFARYIMQNARLLQDMSICIYFKTNEREKTEMIKRLSLCTRFSSSCKLSIYDSLYLDNDYTWVVRCVL